MPEPARPSGRQQIMIYARLCLLLAAGILAYLYLVAPLFSRLQGRPSAFLVWNPGPETMNVRTTNLFLSNAGTEVPPNSLAGFSAHIGTGRKVRLRLDVNGSHTILRVPTSPGHTVLATPVPLWCTATDQEQLKILAVQPLLAPWLEQLAAGKPGECERQACMKRLQAELGRLCVPVKIRECTDDWHYSLPGSFRNGRDPRLPLLIMPDSKTWMNKPLPLADGQIAIRSGNPPHLMVTVTMPWGKPFPAPGKTKVPGSRLTVLIITEGDLSYTEARLTCDGREICPPLLSPAAEPKNKPVR